MVEEAGEAGHGGDDKTDHVFDETGQGRIVNKGVREKLAEMLMDMRT